MLYIGIDPGKSGGLVSLQVPDDRRGCTGRSIQRTKLTRMPDTLRDIDGWFEIASSAEHSMAAIEKVHSSPQMGVASAFTFGREFGQLEAMLSAYGIPLIDPDGTLPNTWQKALGIKPRKKKKGKGRTGETTTQWKTRLRDMAQRMFPGLEVWKRTKGEQLCVADALLLAEYCRRKDQGIL